jgi:hypothetical protein
VETRTAPAAAGSAALLRGGSGYPKRDQVEIEQGINLLFVLYKTKRRENMLGETTHFLQQRTEPAPSSRVRRTNKGFASHIVDALCTLVLTMLRCEFEIWVFLTPASDRELDRLIEKESSRIRASEAE